MLRCYCFASSMVKGLSYVMQTCNEFVKTWCDIKNVRSESVSLLLLDKCIYKSLEVTMADSICDAYANWIYSHASNTTGHSLSMDSSSGAAPVLLQMSSSLYRESARDAVKIGKVGIIGAGMSGLYAGLLLKKHGIPFHIFEARKERVGGRVYTYRFDQQQNQYFEAGAMRLPCIPSQTPVFDLIDYLNKQRELPSQMHIEKIDYYYKYPNGNLVCVNGKRMTLDYANKYPDQLGFDGLDPVDAKRTADQLMDEAMEPLLREFQQMIKKFGNQKGAEKFFDKYDRMSLRYYLANLAKPKPWYHAKINYVEVMTAGTNAFTYGVVESVIEYQDFNTSKSGWKTIKNGMSRLPEACAAVIGGKNITKGATVYKIEVKGDKAAVTYSTDSSVPSSCAKTEEFDKLLVAVPPPVLRMIERPKWSSQKEDAIRACNIMPLYKLGLQFKTRFWEDPKKVENPTYGGQSTTDLPSRWIVYPSYGIKEGGKGVLLTYSWSTDALNMVPASDEEKKSRALQDLQKLYPKVDIANEFTGEYRSVHWTAEWSMGIADFLPGQFKELFPYLQQSEGNIHFAGEHISMRHGWIVGAMESALYVCKQMFPAKEFEYLK